MAKQHSYVLGLNTYDHDVSACLLRDGAIAFAIAKERITREKHASGFYKEVIDYCLDAEGITLDDVDLIVRNCYILPVPEMEERLVYFDAPGFLPEFERGEAVAQRGDPDRRLDPPRRHARSRGRGSTARRAAHQRGEGARRGSGETAGRGRHRARHGACRA